MASADPPTGQLICGWLATGLSLSFLASPFMLIFSLIRKKIPAKEVNWLVMIMNYLNCLIWFSYGIRQSKAQIIICNFIGLVLNLVYFLVFLLILLKKKKAKLSIAVMLFLVGSICIFLGFYSLIKSKSLISSIIIVINILMYVAPGAKILTAIKKYSIKLIPIHISVLGALCSLFWAIYGIFISDITVIIPNVFGLTFSLMQVLAWVYIKVAIKRGVRIVLPVASLHEEK